MLESDFDNLMLFPNEFNLKLQLKAILHEKLTLKSHA